MFCLCFVGGVGRRGTSILELSGSTLWEQVTFL